MVGQNLQQLEVSEEKALQREENYQNQLRVLTESLKVTRWWGGELRGDSLWPDSISL